MLIISLKVIPLQVPIECCQLFESFFMQYRTNKQNSSNHQKVQEMDILGQQQDSHQELYERMISSLPSQQWIKIRIQANTTQQSFIKLIEIIYQAIDQMENPPQRFKDYPIEKRIKIFKDNEAKNKNTVICIVEKHPKCKALPDLKHCKFSIAQDQKIMEVCNAIRQRIINIDQKYETQPFFLYVNKSMPPKEYSVKQVYGRHKDPEDGLLYFMYSNMDPYGSD